MPVTDFAAIEADFVARAHAMVWCSLATVDTRDRVRSRIVHPIWDGGAGWIGTRPETLKARHIAHNPYVSLAYIADIVRPAYADCFASWADDPAERQHAWDLFRTAPAPLGFDYGTVFAGPQDPAFAVLKVTPWRIELGDATDRAQRRVWRRAKGMHRPV